MTPDEGDQAQPQTPDTDVYEVMGNEDNFTPTLAQWEKAIKVAAEETSEKIPGEKRKDYISHGTWEKIREFDDLNKNTHEQHKSGGTDKCCNIIFKPGNRAVFLQGQSHNVTGGYLECQQCGRTANNKNAFSSLCLEGNCNSSNKGKCDKHEQYKAEGEHAQKGTPGENIEGNTFQRQQGGRLKKMQADIKRR